MKITYKPFLRTLQQQLEFDALIDAKRKQNLYPTPPSTEQAPSTVRTLAMTDEELAAYRDRPLPTVEQSWVGISELLITAEEFAIEDRRRRSSKNTLGMSEKSSVTLESKERAIAAIVYTPPASVTPEDVEKAVGFVPYISKPLKEIWVKLPWYKALAHWVLGNKIKTTSDDQILPDEELQRPR